MVAAIRILQIFWGQAILGVMTFRVQWELQEIIAAFVEEDKRLEPPPDETPSPSPRSTNPRGRTCEDTPNWANSYGDGCDCYTNPLFSCDSFRGAMGIARDNCCVCGGGTCVDTPN